MLAPHEIENSLAHFSGTQDHHAHWTRRLRYTDGVKYLAESAEAFWLIDAIASHQPRIKRSGRQALLDFQLWTLTVQDATPELPRRATLVLREDSGPDARPVIVQRIPLTDFPLSLVRLYVEDEVLLLPSEH